MYSKLLLSEFENRLTESKNVLTYTMHLLFPPILPDMPVEDCVNDIWEITFRNCSKLLNNGNLNFFGQYLPSAASDTEFSLAEMASPSSYRLIWSKFLMQHCIMSTFDKLHNIIFSNEQLTPYDIVRRFTDVGFHYSLTHNGFKITALENQFIFNDGLKKSHYGIIKSENTASLTTAAKRRLRDLSCALPEELITLKPIPEVFRQAVKSGKLPGNYAVTYQLLNGRCRNFKRIFKLYSAEKAFSISSSNMKEIITFIKEITDEPTFSVKRNGAHSEPIERVDYLYYKYCLEQLFNFDLIYCLDKNINELDRYCNQNFSDNIPFIDFITCCINLPNVFSRYLLVQIAFDSFKTEQDLSSSCLLDRLKAPDVIAKFKDSSTRLTDSHLRLSQWQKRYSDFINYLSKVVFPVYESYFFTLLYEQYNPSHSHQTTADSLLKLYFALMDYLSSEDVYSEFLHPESIIKNAWNQNRLPNQGPINLESIIVPDYQIDAHLNTGLFRRLTLSAYNHTPGPIPALLNLAYFRDFDNLPERFLDLCTAYAIKD